MQFSIILFSTETLPKSLKWHMKCGCVPHRNIETETTNPESLQIDPMVKKTLLNQLLNLHHFNHSNLRRVILEKHPHKKSSNITILKLF